jgi:hypothetical protein
MRLKKLILTICFFLTFSVIGVKADYAGFTEQTRVTASAKTTSEYTYVRVFADGSWWIYVYLDGTLILVLPDDDE